MELAGRVRQDEACEGRKEVARDNAKLGRRLATEQESMILLCRYGAGRQSPSR